MRGLLVAVLALLSIQACRWSLRHPFGVTWDESNYINFAYRDAQFLRHDGPGRAAKAMIFEDRGRPPAMRIVALPFTAIFGPSVILLRLISLGCLWITAWLFYQSAKRLSDEMVAGAATLLLLAIPFIDISFLQYSTEFPLLLAIALLFHALIRHWQEGTHGPWLALSLALGSLARLPFAFVALPVLVVALVHARRDRRALWWIVISCFAAAVVIAPWYWWNLAAAVDYAHYAQTYIRHLAGTGMRLWWLLIYGIGVPALLGVAASIGRRKLNDVQQLAAIASVASMLLVLGSMFASINGNVRYCVPQVIPACLLLAMFVRRPMVLALAAVIQIFVALVEPRALLRPDDLAGWRGVINGPRVVFEAAVPWDWRPLYRPGVRTIAYLGSGHEFNSASIVFPWIARGENPRVATLWRYENGPIDWNQVMRDAAGADLVVTAPGYVGDPFDHQERDNAHNAELVQRLGGRPAETLVMPDARVVVFVRAGR